MRVLGCFVGCKASEYLLVNADVVWLFAGSESDCAIASGLGDLVPQAVFCGIVRTIVQFDDSEHIATRSVLKHEVHHLPIESVPHADAFVVWKSLLGVDQGRHRNLSMYPAMRCGCLDKGYDVALSGCHEAAGDQGKMPLPAALGAEKDDEQNDHYEEQSDSSQRYGIRHRIPQDKLSDQIHRRC